MTAIARSIRIGIGLAAALLLAMAAAEARAASDAELGRIKHIIVIYLENRSFDNLYGLFPGASGIEQAGEAARQTNLDGVPYERLPPPIETGRRSRSADPRFPADLPNGPFRIEPFVSIGMRIPDLVHRFYQEQAQIDGGSMDRFAAVSDAGGLAMGYYDGSAMALWDYAKRFTLADRFFHAAFGGSFLNHFWLICACTPRYPRAPANLVAQLDASGRLVKDGAITPQGYAVNTIQSSDQPHSAKITDPAALLPLQTMATIGDRLSARNIGWAWYSGGWDDALAGHPDAKFQFHHQPFAYFERYATGTAARSEHLKDAAELLAGIDSGKLPSVTFYKPLGRLSQHPGYAELVSGDRHAADVLGRIERSPLWSDSLVILTYDENGGLWDHVPPPKIDEWGPGARVPTLIVSPYAKKGFVDHTVYDTTSILRLIERRFGIEPLGSRDRNAADLTNALAF